MCQVIAHARKLLGECAPDHPLIRAGWANLADHVHALPNPIGT